MNDLGIVVAVTLSALHDAQSLSTLMYALTPHLTGDVWSAACILMEMVLGTPLFPASTPAHLAQMLHPDPLLRHRELIQYLTTTHPYLHDVIAHSLCLQPHHRMSAEQLLRNMDNTLPAPNIVVQYNGTIDISAEGLEDELHHHCQYMHMFPDTGTCMGGSAATSPELPTAESDED
jgi:serine/threonine protein kinase